MTSYVKICPDCKNERPQFEFICEAVREDGLRCEFPLIEVTALPRGMAEEARPPPTPPVAPGEAVAGGANGKGSADQPAASQPVAAPAIATDGACAACYAPVEPDDAVCISCGAALGPAAPVPDASERRIGVWTIVADLPCEMSGTGLFLVRREAGDAPSLLRLLPKGLEPDAGLYPVLSSIDHPNVPRLLANGQADDRAFEVWEHVEGPTLAEIAPGLGRDVERLEDTAGALIGALTLFERRGLRHGNLTPALIRQRRASPLVLAITDFSIASIAEFDVQAGRQRAPNRYMAPEAIVAASTSGSDWWSLGIILLELLTKGDCFKDVDERAFLLHVVSRGVAIPENLPPRWRNLLEGLLTRDHSNRWKSEQALQWITSDKPVPTSFEGSGRQVPQGEPFRFADREFTSPADLALYAAQAAHWGDALADLEHGRLATWLSTFDATQKRGESYDLVSRIGSDSRIPPDQRLALALAAMNRDLPLCVRGEILNSGVLLEAPATAAHWFFAPVLSTVRKLKRDRDRWLLQLAERADRVHARAKDAKLDIDHETFATLRLVTSTAALGARWAKQRAIFPDSPNATVASLIERRSPSDEDLLLLHCIRPHHFKPLEEVLREAEALAKGRPDDMSPVPEFDRAAAIALLARPRRDLVDELNQRIPGFQRCQRPKVDEWVDSYRSSNRRMPLARLVATLAVPPEEWKEPPEQDYVRSVLGHMHRRVLAGIQKGALVQMRATSSNLDLSVLGQQQIGDLLDAIVSRGDQEHRLASRTNASAAFFNNVRALNNKAGTFHRDTGMEALYVGYPFLTLLDRTEDGDRTRIAPLLLWPVRLSIAPGATGSISTVSDRTREVTLNPALETILGAATFEQWSTTIGTAISDGFDTRAAVLRALSDLVPSDIPDTIGPLPKATSIKSPNVPAVRSAAALFLAEFPSQAIAHDLDALQQRPLSGTALHCLLRLGSLAPARLPVLIPQIERFETLEADPSQQEAVAFSRQAPGLVVQGPPGTGKSQTIVNIISDCLGRGESVLVVCEKKAALDVVQKRLAAERLGDRVVRVENTTTDRKPLIDSLKSQVHAVRNDDVNHAPAARQKRIPIAAKIDALETELDAYHEAVHATDPSLGLSHREVLALIAAQNLESRGLSAPALRQALGSLTATDLETAIGACTGLVDVWLAGGIPGQPLAALKPLAVDQAQAEGIAALLRALFAADAARLESLGKRKLLPERHRSLNCPDNAALQDWLQTYGQELSSLPANALGRCAAWRPYFSATGSLKDEGARYRNALAELIGSLDGLAMPGPAQLAHGAVAQWPETDIISLAAALPVLRAEPSLLGFFNLPATLRRRAAHHLLAIHKVTDGRTSVVAHAEAAGFEAAVRTHAARLGALATSLATRLGSEVITQRNLLSSAQRLAGEIDAFVRFAEIIDACPVPDFWLHIVAAADDQSSASPLGDLIAALSTVQDVADARAKAAGLIQQLRAFLEAPVADRMVAAIAKDLPLGLNRDAMLAALPALVPFQTFRLRYKELPAPSQATFDHLAPIAADLAADTGRTPRTKIEALMRREAACAWKEAIETRRPLLQRLHSEIAASVVELEGLDSKIREANRRLLATVDREKVRDAAAWSPTWAGGAASKRLRQVFKLGSDLGLLHLKPIWLVNPDVASRMLPLEAGLFDVAIFDEASQMRVVNALPALYRAKRSVVSGDEKQLPPTSFFGVRSESIQNDVEDGGGDDAPEFSIEDVEFEDDDADAEAAPRLDPRALQLAEQHIRDCEDLLALSRGHLPETSLDIHYRSQYRELIAFSNAAYYGGRLNVPISKSPAEVLRARPIEVLRIDGLYKNQTNPQEADAVVDFLTGLWARDGTPPTVGVVTFNMKQAEFISSRLEARADQDRAFGKAYLRERTRKAQGEDVGFFVKNLENVQGDERDWIVFSTTFGRDEDGVFRRAFGALNQQGGERRLNVAVTRAKQKVVIVTSMPTSEISDALGSGRPPVRARDYLQIYMQYAELVSAGDTDDAIKLLEMFGPPDPRGALPIQYEPDELIQQALAALHHEGIQASLLPREDAFSVDIAIIEPGASRYIMGVEFDSPRHQLLRRARAREVWRPKLMTRSGLRLHRISSAEWVRSPDAEQARLIAAARDALAEETPRGALSIRLEASGFPNAELEAEGAVA